MSRNGGLTVLLLILVPILLVFYIGSQMAYSQVADRFTAYQNIPEISRRSELAKIPPGQVIMLRGQIAQIGCKTDTTSTCQDSTLAELLIFQEQPATGREVRYQEEFALVFPEFILRLPDGAVKIIPSQTRDRVIRHELHQVPDGGIIRTGFRPEDTVMVQGQWQPGTTTLNDTTGITGADKASLMVEWQGALQKVYWLRNGLGTLTLLGTIMLVVRLRRERSRLSQENKDWPTPTTTATPRV